MSAPKSVRNLEWLRALRDDPAVTGTRLLVLLTVGTYLNGSGFLSVDQIAASTGLGRRTVIRHLGWARRTGWLVQTRRGHRLGNGGVVASEYQLAGPSTGQRRHVDDDDQHDTSGTLTESQGANGDAQRANGDAQGAAGGTPCTSLPEPLHPEEDRRDSQASHDVDVSEDARDLCRYFVTEHCRPNSHGVPTEGTKAHATWLREMDRLVRIGPPNTGQGIDPDRVREVIAWMAAHRGNGDFPGWSAVCESVPTFRKKFTKIAASAGAAARNGSGRQPAQQVSEFTYSGRVQP